MASGGFTLVLHSHLPWVLHHGRWPHGTDWLNEAAAETYLPLARLLARLLEPLRSLPHVGEVRQRGLMCGVELVADRRTKEPFPPGWLVGKRVCDALRDDGVILRPLGDVLVLMPIPATSEDDLAYLVTCVAKRTEEVTGDAGARWAATLASS